MKRGCPIPAGGRHPFPLDLQYGPSKWGKDIYGINMRSPEALAAELDSLQVIVLVAAPQIPAADQSATGKPRAHRRRDFFLLLKLPSQAPKTNP